MAYADYKHSFLTAYVDYKHSFLTAYADYKHRCLTAHADYKHGFRRRTLTTNMVFDGDLSASCFRIFV